MMETIPLGRTRAADLLDRVAMLCSAACLVHCVALPLLILALPVLAVWLSVPEDAHLWLLSFAVPAAITALWLGYRSHGHRVPVIAGAVGLLFLGAGAWADGLTEVVLTVTGSVCLVTAHLGNLRLRRRCRCCEGGQGRSPAGR